MDQVSQDSPIRIPLLVKLAAGPALLLLAGWRAVFDIPDTEALRYCVKPFWSWTEGPIAWLLVLLGLVLTWKSVGSAWRLRWHSTDQE